jgi:zinc-ribbon domain
MNCPSCGTSNSDDAKFCNQCGDAQGNAPPKGNPRADLHGARPIVAGLLFVGLLVLALVTYAYQHSDKSPTGSDDPHSSGTWVIQHTTDHINDQTYTSLSVIEKSEAFGAPNVSVMCADGDPTVVLPIFSVKYVTPRGEFDGTRLTEVTYRFDQGAPVSNFWQTGSGPELAYHSWHMDNGNVSHLWPEKDGERLRFMSTLLTAKTLIFRFQDHHGHDEESVFAVAGLEAALRQNGVPCKL